jgi:hypothetical protein
VYPRVRELEGRLPGRAGDPAATDDPVALRLIPADALITADPPMFVLDGLELPLAPAEADRLRRLAPTLTGRVPLSAMSLPDEDAALVRQLREQGVLFDLCVSVDSVPTV